MLVMICSMIINLCYFFKIYTYSNGYDYYNIFYVYIEISIYWIYVDGFCMGFFGIVGNCGEMWGAV